MTEESLDQPVRTAETESRQKEVALIPLRQPESPESIPLPDINHFRENLGLSSRPDFLEEENRRLADLSKGLSRCLEYKLRWNIIKSGVEQVKGRQEHFEYERQSLPALAKAYSWIQERRTTSTWRQRGIKNAEDIIDSLKKRSSCLLGNGRGYNYRLLLEESVTNLFLDHQGEGVDIGQALEQTEVLMGGFGVPDPPNSLPKELFEEKTQAIFQECLATPGGTLNQLIKQLESLPYFGEKINPERISIIRRQGGLSEEQLEALRTSEVLHSSFLGFGSFEDCIQKPNLVREYHRLLTDNISFLHQHGISYGDYFRQQLANNESAEVLKNQIEQIKRVLESERGPYLKAILEHLKADSFASAQMITEHLKEMLEVAKIPETERSTTYQSWLKEELGQKMKEPRFFYQDEPARVAEFLENWEGFIQENIVELLKSLYYREEDKETVLWRDYPQLAKRAFSVRGSLIIGFLADYPKIAAGIPDNIFLSLTPEEQSLVKFFKSASTEIRETVGHFFYNFGKIFKEGVPESLEATSSFWPQFRAIGDTRLQGKILESLLTNASFLSSPEKTKSWLTIALRIDKTPSQEIKRIAQEVLQLTVDSDNPEATFNQIEKIFLTNNLPYTARVFKIFDLLYAKETRWAYSPVLKKASPRRAKDIIYRDLLYIHINSGNRSLRHYVSFLSEGQKLISRYEENPQNLTSQEMERLRLCLRRARSLLDISLLGRWQSKEQPRRKREISDEIRQLKLDLEAKDGQTITQRLAEMFLKPLGFESLSEIEETINKAKSLAHQRGLAYAASGLELAPGDIIKGVDHIYWENILQNGSVAKNFLGAVAQEDSTPLDTDVSILEEEGFQGETEEERFQNALKSSLSWGYGSGLILVIKDRGQLHVADPKKLTRESVTKTWQPNELFPTPFGYGIRTGFPNTEIDFIVIQDRLLSEEQSLEKIFYAIAQNGFYIPAANQRGELIFTPEMYQEYRQVFDGIEYYDGDPLKITRVEEENWAYEKVRELIPQIKSEVEQTRKLRKAVEAVVYETLKELGVTVRDELKTGIVGAELLDIGSTGRYTNIPGETDFDLTLLLEESDFSRLAERIRRNIINKLRPQFDRSHSENQYVQIRAINCSTTVSEEEKVDIDIGIAKKTRLEIFGSHDAVSAQLGWVRHNLGEEAYWEVAANIILTKKILSAGDAYKRVEHGGFGGIGVENWILQNEGNIEKAFRSFWEAAHDQEGNLIPFEEFKTVYKIWNPGLNVKHLYHDNYIENMRNEGYLAMIKAITAYLSPR